MKSISRLLTVGIIGSLLVTGVLVSQAASWLLDSAMRDYMKTNLHDESRNVSRAIQRGANGLMLDTNRINPAYSLPLSGRYFVVVVDGKSWRSRSLWDEQIAPHSSQDISNDLVTGPKNQQLLWFSSEFKRFGQSVTVFVAADYSPMLEDIRQINHFLLMIWVIAISLLALLQRLIMRFALTPLEVARRQIEQLRTGALTTLSEQVPEELTPLITEINRLQQETQRQLNRSRTAVADLSHALKTPLAVLRTLIEREQIRNNLPLYEAFNLQLEDMRLRVTRELAQARTAGTQQTKNLFDIDVDLPLLLETLHRAHQEKVLIDHQTTLKGRIPWEREDILEILGNLLDNACKWCNTTVKITIQHVDAALEIEVSDDGSGIDEINIPQALQRGERLDSTVAGHGLGLAIVADKVAAYQGTLAFEKNTMGGLNARVRLPWQ